MSTNIIQIVNEASPPDYSTGAVALLAVAVSGITAYFTYRLGRKQIQDPIRAQWIEIFRESVASYLDVLLEYVESFGEFHTEYLLKQKSSDEVYALAKLAENIITNATRRINRIELMLDTGVPSHDRLLKVLNSFMAESAVFNDKYPDTHPEKAKIIAQTFGAHIREILQLSSSIVTLEWKAIATEYKTEKKA